MIARSRSRSRCRSIGALRLSCLAPALCLVLSSCGLVDRKPLIKIEPVRHEVPAALIDLETHCPVPAVPGADLLAAPQGDAVLAAYLARLESALMGCRGALDDVGKWSRGEGAE